MALASDRFNPMNSGSSIPAASQASLRRALILAGLFLLAVGSAWGWYNINPKRFDTMYQFTVRTQLSGMTYRTNAVDETVTESLATTNMVDGVFSVDGAPKFRVFMGTWDSADSKQMGVVAHTPDICWLALGMLPVAQGQPRSTVLDFQGVKIPFELRIFQSRDKSHLEMAMWCTLISGQVFEESPSFEASKPTNPGASLDNYDAGQHQGEASRAHSAGQFVGILKNRIAGDGSKQFVRFSTGVDQDWKSSLAELQRFSTQWLELHVTHPSVAGGASVR